MHVMELHVLPGGDMGDPVRIFLGQLRQSFKLPGVQPAAGDLDALHARRVPQRVWSFG